MFNLQSKEKMNHITIIQTDTSHNNAIVPFGTHAVTNKLGDYVLKYKSIARKTAEHIIALASTLVEARQELNQAEFEGFCHEVGLVVQSATFRKLTKIGENSSRFVPYMHKIPNAWTTIYELAKLEPEKFDKVASSGVLSTFMSANELFAEIEPSKESKSKSKAKSQVAVTHSSNSLVISFEALSKEAAKDLHTELKALMSKFGIELNLDSSLSAQLGG